MSRATVPWVIRTGPLELMNDTNTRKGDAEFSRSVTVTYRPTPGAVVLNLQEYYNNSNLPRANVMRRDGTSAGPEPNDRFAGRDCIDVTHRF